jgi:predicted metal-dependent RNase
MDILKNVTEELAEFITEANFEGANIVLYTDNEKFFKEGEGKIKEIVNRIKKRRKIQNLHPIFNIIFLSFKPTSSPTF